MTDFGSQRRLLFLLPYAPRLDATHGGGRVVAQFLARLATQHRIALLYFRGLGEPPLDEIFRERCELAQEVMRPWAGQSAVQRLVRNGRLITSLFGLRPMWVTDWASKSYAHRVRSIVQAWQPDIVQIEYHIMGQYLSALNGCTAPRVLTEYEPSVRAAPYLKRLYPIFGRPVYKLDRFAWMRFESEIIRRVQAVVVFTEQDKTVLEKYGLQTPIFRIPFGTLIPERPCSPVGYPPLSLLFIGNFMHPPNVRAAIRLVRTIFPPLRKHYPELELYIVGDRPPAELRKLSGDKIFITGQVADLTPYFDRAAVAVAPLSSGGGMRVKVLEALAAGKAIVASPLSIEGLDLLDGEQLLRAESDQDFVYCINQLLTNSEHRAALAKRARIWACANLRWEKSIERYEELYQRLLSAQGVG